MLKRENEDLKFLRITELMPKLIAEKHDMFMSKFNQTGESDVINKQFLHFMKDKDKCIFPVEIIINLYYSQTYNYCFVCMFNPIKEMTPFKDGKKYSIKELIFMTVGLEEGQLYEVSENTRELIKTAGFKDLNNVEDL